MLSTEHVLQVFPGINDLSDRRLRQLCLDVWRYVTDRNPAWTDIGRIPLHPTLPIATHGTLIAHVAAMARLAEALAPLYRELWAQDLDLDTFRAAAYVHDAAKVIEFTESPTGLQAIAGYNHAIEAGRIVRELGGPEGLAHMAEAHSFSGPLVLPRTRDAQLFLLMDPMCLNAFPEQGPGVFERHLKANGWEAPRTLEGYRPPR